MSSQAATSGNNKTSSLPLIIGVVGLIIAFVGLFMGLGADEPNGRPVLSLLMGVGLWLSVLIGMLYLIQLGYLFDAGWSIIIRRQLEHMVGGVWIVLAVLLAVIGISYMGGNEGLIWKWMNPDQVIHGHKIAEDPLYTSKAVFLNEGFFVVRIITYLVVLTGLATLLRKWSFINDTNPDPANVSKCRKLSALGIILTSFTTTFFAFDVFMSLSYHWFSTMYGVWYFTVAMRTGLAITILLCNWLAVKGHLKGIYKQPHNYLLGCLSLAFTVFWAYISFSQYFLIYNANIPEETFWYQMRELTAEGSKSQWWFVSLALVFCHFVIPFIALLFYKTKVIASRLKFISCWILAFCVLDLYFNIVPSPIEADNALGYIVTPFISPYMFFDLAAIAGVGGLVLWTALKSMKKTEPVPIHDPRINESMNYHE